MKNQYSGMTVNERLYSGGYLDEFDKAVKEKDTAKIEAILRNIELDESSIKAILKHYDFRS